MQFLSNGLWPRESSRWKDSSMLRSMTALKAYPNPAAAEAQKKDLKNQASTRAPKRGENKEGRGRENLKLYHNSSPKPEQPCEKLYVKPVRESI